jgi:peptidoglycan/LPS O-acetylase OafA/YrhL
MSSPKTTRVEFANALRGIAVICVLISHYCAVFWLGRDSVSTLINSPLLPDLYQPPVIFHPILATFNHYTSLGLLGVGLFFLISGFVIPFSFERYKWKEFLIGRAFRILPTYAIGFSITLLSVYCAGLYFHRSFPYHFQEIITHYIPGLQDIVGAKGMDGVVWTLSIEVRFYLVCALFYSWLQQPSKKILYVPLGIGLIALILNPLIPTWESTHVLWNRLASIFVLTGSFIIYMFIGVAFHLYYKGIVTYKKFILWASLLFLLFLAILKFSIHAPTIGLSLNYLLAIPIFLLAAKYTGMWCKHKFFVFFANISYPLYACHCVFGFVVLRILLDLRINTITAYLIAISSAASLSWLIHTCIEKPTNYIGKKIADRQKEEANEEYKSEWNMKKT